MSNPFKAENKFLTYKEIEADKDKLIMSYNAFNDEKSKKIFIEFINWKMTGDVSKLVPYTEGDWLEFFSTDLLSEDDNYTFVDVGAYTGDTIIRFLSFCKGKYDQIIAFEPDETNFQETLKVVNNGRLENVTVYKTGLWSNQEEKKFYSVGNGTAYESSNFYRGVENTISSARCQEIGESNVQMVLCDTLDNQIKGIIGKMIIKIDAFASEFPILLGGGLYY